MQPSILVQTTLKSLNKDIKPPSVPKATAAALPKPTAPRTHVAAVSAPVAALPPAPPAPKIKPPSVPKQEELLAYPPYSKPKGFPKPKKDDRKYTMDELIDFKTYDYDKPIIFAQTGVRYRENEIGVNPRGDVVSVDFTYLGRWDKETKTIIPTQEPDDWPLVERASQF